MEAAANIQLSPEDRARLEGWGRGRNTPQKLVWRARIVLMWGQGAGLTAIVRATGKTKRTAYRWRDRYIAHGVAGGGGGAGPRPAPPRPQTASVGGRDRAGRRHDAAREAGVGHALVGAQAR